MGSPSRYVRSLSPFERMWIAAQSSCQFFVVEGSGQLNAQVLQDAVNRASLANPGSRLRLRGVGPWARWEETDLLPTVTEVDGKGWDARGADGMPFSDFAHMSPRQAPSASYVIIHGKQTRLVQRTHHGTVDGIGAIMFLREVFRALRDEPLVGAPATKTDLELARELGGRLQKLKQDCLSPFSNPSNGRAGSTWARVQVNGTIQKKPLQRSILALAAFARRAGPGEVFIDIPVNLRDNQPGPQGLGNLTGSIRLVVAPDATIESIEQDILGQLAAKRQVDPIVSAAYLRFLPIALMRCIAHSMVRRAIATNRFTPTATASNLGMLDLNDFSSADFHAQRCMSIPPGYDGVPLFLSLVGHANGIDLCARAPVALAAGGHLNTLLEDLARMLSKPSRAD